MYERRGDIDCKKYDLVNKQIDTDRRQLDCKLCDLIYLLVALIFCHIRRSIFTEVECNQGLLQCDYSNLAEAVCFYARVNESQFATGGRVYDA